MAIRKKGAFSEIKEGLESFEGRGVCQVFWDFSGKELTISKRLEDIYWIGWDVWLVSESQGLLLVM